MANEFIHIDPGAILTKAEFELITGHQFNSQATGDILYASDSTQLSRLGIGSNTNVLEITGGVPAWVATSGTGSVARVTSPTFVTPALGTPASGVMTNVSGTASSLTAGTVTTNANLTGHVTSSGNAAVLGSFSSAQLATALTNETGSGAAVFGISPTLVTPALGTPASGVLTNATGLPTTGILDNAVTLGKMAGITRGSIIYGDSSGDPAALAKGTEDYVLTAGASDISWAAAGGGGPSQATQAALEAETNEDTYAPPDLIKHSPGVAKWWCKWAGGSTTIEASYNITSVSDDGTGDSTVSITNAFSGNEWMVTGGFDEASGGQIILIAAADNNNQRFLVKNLSGTLSARDPASFHGGGWGDQ